MAYQAIRGGGSGLQFLNNPFGDTTYTKVFVGGLAWETKSETLHSYFEKFGDILEAVVISDKHTGRSKGYGFVSSLLFPFFFILIYIFYSDLGAHRCDFNNSNRIVDKLD